MEENLDLIEEEMEIAEARMLQEKVQAEQYFNKRIRFQTFKVGDLFLKKNMVTTQDEGKMGSR